MVTKEQGQSLASEFGIEFFETSAKNNINVEEAFTAIATAIKNKKPTAPVEPAVPAADLTGAKPGNKKSCCG